MKNWKRLAIIILSAIMVISGILLVACKEKGEEQPDDPTINYDDSQEKISMTVSVGSEKINVKISSNADEAGNATVKVVSMKAYEYLGADSYNGLSASVSAGTAVGEYTLGTDYTLTVSRYSNGYDNLYNKYYIVDADGTILKGPVYATEVDASVSATPAIGAATKKGIVGADVDTFTDLQATHVTLNFAIESMLYANETWDEDDTSEALELTDAQRANAIEFVSNGKTFYFRKDTVRNYDASVKQFYSAGANITVVVSAQNNSVAQNDLYFPQKMTYAPYSTTDTQGVSINTSNSFGFEYYVALMEFIANRYTTVDQSGNFTNGFVSTFVIGNEVDYASQFNRISENRADFDKFMEEYSRLLRLSNLVVKKYHSDINVAMPLSHAWATAMDNESYAPKTMIEWLNNKTKLEGDYNWGIAPHVYGNSVYTSQVFEYDTDSAIENKGLTSDYNTTAQISLSNIELLDMYLNKDELTFGGKARNVYLTEYGISSTGNYGDTVKRDENGEMIQAGVIAATWYKISQLDSIVCYNYFCLCDSFGGGSESAFGLITEGSRDVYKPSYMLWKYIDTQYSQTVASQYLSYISYYKNGVLATPASYMDLLNTLGTSYDLTGFDWSKASPREIDAVYDWESQGDMTGNYALDGSFIEDGQAHTVTVATRNGVTVRYSVNGGELTATKPTRTAVGSDTVLVNFYEGNTLLGTRQVKLTVGARVETNKSVYNYGEKILFNVTLDKNDGLTSHAWVGLVSAEEWNNGLFNREQMGLVASTRVFKDGQYYTRTFSFDSFVIDGVRQATLPAGEYYVYYSANVGYSQLGEVFKIRVLAEGEESGLVDLTGVKFADAKFDVTADQEEPHSIAVQGLPDDVTVEYVGNEQTVAGVYNVCALIKKDGVLLEKRYAVMTLELIFDDFDVDKTTFVYGEAIYVTAIANATKSEKTLKVGLFEKDTENLIAYYFVKDTAQGHLSGRAFNILSTDALVGSSSSLATVGGYKLLKTGEYTLRLYVDGQDVIKSIDITVEEGLTFELNKTSFEMDEDVLVTAYGVPEDGSSLFKGSLQVVLFSADDLNPLTGRGVYPIFTIKVDESNTGNALVLQGQNPSVRPFEGKLPAGNYVLYMAIIDYVTDSDGTYSVYNVIGESQSFTVVGEDEDYPVPITILNGEDVDGIPHFGPTDDIQVRFDMRTVALYEYGAWLMVCPASEDNYGNYGRYLWGYLNGRNSDFNIGLDGLWTLSSAQLTGGDYKIVLFYDNGYNVLATANFTLEEMGDVSFYIVEGESSFKFGSTIHVKVDPTNLRPDAWLGVFSDAWRTNPGYAGSYQSVETITVSELAENDYVWELYLPATKGVVSGTNWIVLFRGEGSFVEATDPIQIDVTPDPSLVKSPEIVGGGTEFNQGEVVEFQFYIDYLFESAWCALYTAYRYDHGFSYMTWKYILKSSAEVGTDFTIADNDYVYVLDTADLYAGEYVMVLFIDEGHTEVTHIRFTVNGEKRLEVDSDNATVTQGDTIDIKFDTTKFANGAWIAVWLESSYACVYDGNYISWAWVYIHDIYNGGDEANRSNGVWHLNTSQLAPGRYVVAVVEGGWLSLNVCEITFTVEAAAANTVASDSTTSAVAVSVDYFIETKRGIEA